MSLVGTSSGSPGEGTDLLPPFIPAPHHPPPSLAVSSGRPGAGERLRLFIPGESRRLVHPSQGWRALGGGSSPSVCPSPRGAESNWGRPFPPAPSVPAHVWPQLSQPPSRCLPGQISVPFPSPEALTGMMGSARSMGATDGDLEAPGRWMGPAEPPGMGVQSWCSQPRWMHLSGDVWGRLFFHVAPLWFPLDFYFCLKCKNPSGRLSPASN